ncbi:MAG: hypothetical protein ACI80S_001520 [Pseudohongiellaceae bacterium]|jgi:hypothetical protein
MNATAVIVCSLLDTPLLDGALGNKLSHIKTAYTRVNAVWPIGGVHTANYFVSPKSLNMRLQTLVLNYSQLLDALKTRKIGEYFCGRQEDLCLKISHTFHYNNDSVDRTKMHKNLLTRLILNILSHYPKFRAH